MTQKHPLCLRNGEISTRSGKAIFNIEDYGAINDGMVTWISGNYTISGTDNSVAIQAAINAASTYAIANGDVYNGQNIEIPIVFFPPGMYLVSNTITISNSMALVGENTQILVDNRSTAYLTTKDVFFANYIYSNGYVDIGDPNSVSDVNVGYFKYLKFINIDITTGWKDRNAGTITTFTWTKTTGFAIHVRRSVNLEISNVNIQGILNGIWLQGCTNAHIDNVSIYVDSPNLISSGSACIKLSPMRKSTDTALNPYTYDQDYHKVYTSSITRCIIGSVADFGILIEGADGLVISDIYMTTRVATIKMKGFNLYLKSSTSGLEIPYLLGIVQINNIYFDSVDPSFSPHEKINIEATQYTNISDIFITSCFFGNRPSNAINILGNSTDKIHAILISSCMFNALTSFGISASDAPTLFLSIVGCSFLSCCSLATQAYISIDDINSIIITECYFTPIAGSLGNGINLSGSISKASISNNIFDAITNTDINNTATISNISQVGNITSKTTKIATSIPGSLSISGVISSATTISGTNACLTVSTYDANYYSANLTGAIKTGFQLVSYKIANHPLTINISTNPSLTTCFLWSIQQAPLFTSAYGIVFHHNAASFEIGASNPATNSFIATNKTFMSMIFADGTVNFPQGIKIANGATNGNILKGNGTAFVSVAPGVLTLAGAAAPFTLSVSNANCLVSNSTFTIGLSGQLEVANGGTGVSTLDDGYAIKARGQQNFSIFPIFDSGSNISLGYSTYTRTVSIAGITSITNATASSATSNGALVVAGGVGIAKQLYVGDNIYLASGKYIYYSTTQLLGSTGSQIRLGYQSTQSLSIGDYCTSTIGIGYGSTGGIYIGQSATGDINIGYALNPANFITLGTGSSAAYPVKMKLGTVKNIQTKTKSTLLDTDIVLIAV